MQKIFLVGFVGRDPEERFTPTEKKVTSFPIGINMVKGGEKVTIWYKIACWNGQCSNIMPHIKKGSYLIICGDLNVPTTYQNKKGDISIDLSVSAHSISFVSSPKQEKEEQKEDHPSVFEWGETK